MPVLGVNTAARLAWQPIERLPPRKRLADRCYSNYHATLEWQKVVHGIRLKSAAEPRRSGRKLLPTPRGGDMRGVGRHRTARTDGWLDVISKPGGGERREAVSDYWSTHTRVPRGRGCTHPTRHTQRHGRHAASRQCGIERREGRHPYSTRGAANQGDSAGRQTCEAIGAYLDAKAPPSSARRQALPDDDVGRRPVQPQASAAADNLLIAGV